MARTPDALSHPALLIWARKSIGLSLDEAANRLGIAVERLQSWETGEAKPTIAQLRNCAQIYRRPLAVFFLSEPPEDFSVPHDYRLLRQTDESVLSPEARVEMRRIQFQRDIAVQVADADEAPVFDLLGHAMLESDVESLAINVRDRLAVRLSDQQRWPNWHAALNAWRSALEGLGVLVFHFENTAVDELRGFSVAHERLPIVAVNGKDSPSGRVFTLLHELGHLLLNREGACDMEEASTAEAQDQQVEAFCNSLAASILMPAEAVRRFFNLSLNARSRSWSDDELRSGSRQFRVSREALLRRLVTLGAATFPFYLSVRRRLLREHAAMESQRTEPSREGGPPPSTMAVRRVGPAFARIVLHAYDREKITTNDVCEYFGVRAKHIDKIRKLALSTSSLALDGAEE